jgi:PAS domain S-box-containing protein
VCRLVAEVSEFPLVWIGEVRGQRVVPVACAGSAADYLDGIQVEIDGPLGAGPGGTCVRENRTVVNDDFSVNPQTAPWRAAAVRFGFLASAAFPLRRDGRPVAELTLYARDAGAFDAEQIALLESLSADLSYALDALDHEEVRARAEVELEESREKLRLALRSASMGAWRFDLRGQKWHFDDQVCRCLGIDPAHFTGTEGEFFATVHPDDCQELRNALARTIASGAPYEVEYRAVWRDESVHYIAARGQLARDAAGQPMWIDGLVWDITERKRTEQELGESERRERQRAEELAVLFEAVPMPVFIARDPDCLHLTGNRLADEILRIPHGNELSLSAPAEAKPSHFRTLKDGRELRLDELPAQRAARGVHVKDFEFTLAFDDGMVRHVLGYGTPLLDDQGRPRGAVAGLIDITERKRAEEELKQAKEAAEAATEAKSQFLANMSHELRTPMNAILGMIDVALPKAMDPIVQDCLQTARGSADLLLALLNDLLDSAKIESRKLELESTPFSLRRMLDQITRVLSVRASEKGLVFCCRMPNETPDALTGDRMRLQQILLNLAGNAIKFTERGDVEISLRALSQNGEACLEFAVRDTGIGIPPSGLERLFQPFNQADASMARRFGGTGLGLSISKSLVELMGGRIWVESEVGQGSTFRFTVHLPLAKELPADFEVPVALPTMACAPLCILLVEDNPANQKLANYILEDRGHLVEIAGDGEEAVWLTEQNRYDVILMDVQMPGMSGLEATAAIRNREADGRRTPIIAMTAHAMKGDREQCLAAGMDAYLSKPIDGHEMIALVETFAAGSRPVAAAAVSSPTAPLQAEEPPAAAVTDSERTLKRRKAEQRLYTGKARPALDVSETDARALVHELQVHKIELEMQNDELLRAQAAAQVALGRYADLFDFAPVAYFLWDHQARILEVNVAGAALLGLNRDAVIHKRFGQFVAMEHREAFSDFCGRVLATDTKQTCEIKVLKGGQAVGALVEGIAVQNHQGQERLCRAAVIDISRQKRADELAAADRSASEFQVNMSQGVRTPMTAVAPAAVVFDPELALSRCFDSNEMLREMIQCFFEEVDSVFPQMRAALEKGDLVEVGRLGHRMKGTVVYLGAQSAEEAARGAERFCKSSGGTASEAEQAVNVLEQECLMLKTELADHPLSGDPAHND